MDPKERLGVEYNLSHIQVSIPRNAADDVVQAARDRARELHRNLKQGLDFQQAALQYSQGREALEGGSMGWKRLAELPSAFAGEIKKLAPGQISEVFRDESGFHILRLNNRRGGAQSVTQTHVRHILLATNEVLTAEDAVRKADQLRERILNGDDFAQLARSHSSDTASGLKGGNLGWVSPGEMVPEFEKAMNELEINAISKPVKSRYGVHLIQVLGRREQDVSSERERGEARRQIHQRKARERYEQWIRQLRDEAYVEYKVAQ
jgi:peptidyl-prolyl cis-trans isomerase SurA